MNNGIYTSAAGMLTALQRLDIAANNLANINTNGFKADAPFEELLRFFNQGAHPAKEQPVIGGHNLNLAVGPAKTTGRKLDYLIESEGFFAVQTPDGKELYTRNGSFELNQQRELVTAQGLAVVDKFGKKIKLNGQDFSISSKGEVFVDGNFLTTLKIVKFSDAKKLSKVGTNLISAEGTAVEAVANPLLKQGMLEGSNADLMAEMTNMIVIQRSYEFQSRALDTIISQLLRRTVSDIPKPL